MPEPGWTREELGEVVGACAHVRVGGAARPLLREFLAARLRKTRPALAAKVRRLDEGQVAALCRHVREVQAIPW